MTDIVDQAVRSRIMSSIRSKNTKPEMIVRRGLHARGFRFRLHDRRLPGSPDLVFPRHRAVIQVNGCFWHGHDCHLFKWPASRPDFWRRKINANRQRDAKQIDRLLEARWRVLVIWECAFKGRTRRPVTVVLDEAEKWLKSGSAELALKGDASSAV